MADLAIGKYTFHKIDEEYYGRTLNTMPSSTLVFRYFREYNILDLLLWDYSEGEKKEKSIALGFSFNNEEHVKKLDELYDKRIKRMRK